MIQRLDESMGFPNREFGDVYHNPSDPEDKMVFQDFKAYPDGAPNWPDIRTRDRDWKKIGHWMAQQGQIKELNKPNAGMLAMMAVHMLDPKTKQHWFFVKWVKDNLNLRGKFTGIPAGAVSDTHPGLVFKKGASETYRLKPTDIMSGAGPYTAKDVTTAINNIPATAGPPDLILQLQQAVSAAAKRQPWPITIENGAQYLAFHSKYTNEWLAPLALSGGTIPGPDRKNLETNLLAGKSMVNSKIFYSASVTETLSDSSVEASNGMTIYISSKQQGGGAAASLTGIHGVLEKKKAEFGSGFMRNPKVARFVKIVKLIVENGQTDGMLMVALYLGIITEDSWEGIVTGNHKKVAADVKALMKKFNARVDNPNYNPKFHLIAAIAQEVANRLNQEDFTDVFKAIINKASLVQVYMRTKIRDRVNLDILGMDVVWPPVFSGRIIFTAQKNFTSSEVRGKLGFKIT